jgi:hypothetical protein
MSAWAGKAAPADFAAANSAAPLAPTRQIMRGPNKASLLYHMVRALSSAAVNPTPWRVRGQSHFDSKSEVGVLFDHLVGEREQLVWDRETKPSCSLSIN